MASLRIRVEMDHILSLLAGRGKQYITVNELARMLGTSTYSAGRILSHLARQGKIVRWSRRTYKIPSQAVAKTGDGNGKTGQTDTRNS